MNTVAYGGGINSTAMLIGLHNLNINVDLILFADTGCEMPETYQYIEIMNDWLKTHNMPEIKVVRKVDKDGGVLTLEQDCLNSKVLPSIAYGWKKCSLKYKVAPQDKFCNNYARCKDIWALGGKVVKFIGYDAGEENRVQNMRSLRDDKYERKTPLIEWGWWRNDCIAAIQKEGLPVPGKSSCFFCSSMKKAEIINLYNNHHDLLDRAIALEDNAKDNLLTVKGLGRNWSWKNLIEAKENQVTLCGFHDLVSVPCACYDGEGD